MVHLSMICHSIKTRISFALCLVALVGQAGNGATNRVDVPGSLRVNRIGYLENDIKVAVYLGDDDLKDLKFVLRRDDELIDVDSVIPYNAWEPKKTAARIYFSSTIKPGDYTLIAQNRRGAILDRIPVYIGNDAYSRHNLAELPLVYLRQQRCGYNPVHDEFCHQHDGRLVLSGERDGEHVDVTGGWHDASDYLQYLPTTATTVYQLLFAYEQNPGIWADKYDAMGKPGSNGIPDILDEAKWGMDWLKKMNPEPGVFFNQIADDRDHRFVGVPALDSVDYGWGAGKDRPVYPCSGEPYGLLKYKNQSNGLASSVAKFSSAFAIGARIFRNFDKEYARDLVRRANDAYDVAEKNPGACQTAPCVSPYYYEEGNWIDDMELAAAERYVHSNMGLRDLTAAVIYGRTERFSPWMGADRADHYQFYPFINLGHYILASANNVSADVKKEFVGYMRQGLERVAKRGRNNVFLNGIPFIWCSNNLASAFVTQAMLYRELTGDETLQEAETAVRDWIFGLNPWDQIMMILPQEIGPSPLDPHSAMTDINVKGKPGRDWLIGGLVDGPIYTERFNSLWGVHLRNPDPYATLQNPVVVYHDDYADYSTNEPTMDGTASLAYLLGRLCGAAFRAEP